METFRPLAFKIAPMLAAIMPLPTPEITPPVTKMYLVFVFMGTPPLLPYPLYYPFSISDFLILSQVLTFAFFLS
jgi:hypothetical protein